MPYLPLRHKNYSLALSFTGFVKFGAICCQFSIFLQYGAGIHPGTQQPLRKLARDLKSGNSNEFFVNRALDFRFKITLAKKNIL